MTLIAKKRKLVKIFPPQFVEIETFRKISGKDLWECVGEDGKSFLSEAVYRQVVRQSPKRNIQHERS